MIVVIPDMPLHLKEKALRYLNATFSQQFKDVDTDGEGAKSKYKYESIHFSWYNRYSKRVSIFLFVLNEDIMSNI